MTICDATAPNVLKFPVLIDWNNNSDKGDKLVILVWVILSWRAGKITDKKTCNHKTVQIFIKIDVSIHSGLDVGNDQPRNKKYYRINQLFLTTILMTCCCGLMHSYHSCQSINNKIIKFKKYIKISYLYALIGGLRA